MLVLKWIFLILGELLCAAAALYGLWQAYPPAAWIIGGVAGVWALERFAATETYLQSRREQRAAPQVRRSV